MIGTVFIQKLAVESRIGCTDEERREPQTLFIDLKCEVLMTEALATDKREDCVDYVELRQIVLEVAEISACELLETLAQKIARRILLMTYVRSTTISIRKPHKFPGCDAVGIQITFVRENSNPG